MVQKSIENDNYEIECDDCDKPRAVFYQFKEHNESLVLISKLHEVVDDLRMRERSHERFLCNFQLFIHSFI